MGLLLLVGFRSHICRLFCRLYCKLTVLLCLRESWWLCWVVINIVPVINLVDCLQMSYGAELRRVSATKIYMGFFSGDIHVKWHHLSRLVFWMCFLLSNVGHCCLRDYVEDAVLCGKSFLQEQLEWVWSEISNQVSDSVPSLSETSPKIRLAEAVLCHAAILLLRHVALKCVQDHPFRPWRSLPSRVCRQHRNQSDYIWSVKPSAWWPNQQTAKNSSRNQASAANISLSKETSW